MSGGSFTELVVFGDSHSDTGNWVGTGRYPGAPYFAGRFSNGPIWVEVLASELGLPVPTASQIGGSNYAWGGASTGGGYDTINGVRVPALDTQVHDYLAGQTVDDGQLFALFAGHNDFGREQQTDPSYPLSSLTGNITALHDAGAHWFVVVNLPPLGHMPRYRDTRRAGTLDRAAEKFNLLLHDELDYLRSELDVNVYEVDFYSLLTDMIGNPSSYGLTNVDVAAWDQASNLVVDNAQQHLYWDANHFTSRAHAILGREAASLIATEPPLDSTQQPMLQAGDANRDLSFDQLDLIQVLKARKYISGEPATWGEGDWDAAPGGSPDDPPIGDGVFNQFDVIAAHRAGFYLSGPYAAQGAVHHSWNGWAQPVPEPTTHWLIAVSILILSSSRRFARMPGR